MSQDSINKEALLSTAYILLDKGGKTHIADLLKSSDMSINVSGYGQDTYNIGLQFEASLYADVADDIENIEDELHSALSICVRSLPGASIGRVSIGPQLHERPGWRLGKEVPSVKTVEQIWDMSKQRLFISHSSLNKSTAHEIADSLKPFGIKSFVAHDTIEPSVEWLQKIVNALQSCHAMLVLISPKANESAYVHQEVGFALSNRIPTLPLKMGALPLGFFSGRMATPEHSNIPTTKRIVLKWLNSDTRSRSATTSNLISVLATGNDSKSITEENRSLAIELLSDTKHFSQEQLDLLKNFAMKSTTKFTNATALLTARNILKANGVDVSVPQSLRRPTQDDDEYDPFADS